MISGKDHVHFRVSNADHKRTEGKEKKQLANVMHSILVPVCALVWAPAFSELSLLLEER